MKLQPHELRVLTDLVTTEPIHKASGRFHALAVEFSNAADNLVAEGRTVYRVKGNHQYDAIRAVLHPHLDPAALSAAREAADIFAVLRNPHGFTADELRKASGLLDEAAGIVRGQPAELVEKLLAGPDQLLSALLAGAHAAA